MALKAEEVYEAGLELDLDERTAVAHRLLASLHRESGEPQSVTDEAWRQEIAARLDQVLSADTPFGTFEEARARVRSVLDERE